MTSDALIEQWKRDAAAPFAGWDFSYLDGRMIEADPPWSYPDLARAAVARSHDILDIATGGGEVFSSFAPFPGRATAVEGYAPNLPVARARLEPLGVQVHRANTASGMPFEGAAFDLILNRHGGFRPAEMRRVLKPGGVFLTQQVGGDNLGDLAAAFGAQLAYPGNTLEAAAKAFTELGCEVELAQAWRGPVTFADVGALAYFLTAIPWVIEGFDVETHAQTLLGLHRQGGPLRFTYSRFLLRAVRR
ncbi:class I SAM-dependent methyltransferase [Phenylobacterium sp.]|uniref:class I SAM-dependent methyltransferase n=1 Tax=Phenylobacterium sp. TaxID=1871053 RepID=UPI0025E3AF40|nr:class I SAM-dependent methyltransferase [Phenylobacterium sp.]